jgi:hypothetical protein
MRRELESRVRVLEAIKPEEPEVRQAPFPEWLMGEWLARGLRIDPAGRIDWTSLGEMTGSEGSMA